MTFNTRVLIACLLCMLFFACGEKKDIPSSAYTISGDSLISPDKMILILADVHVVEAALLLERTEGVVSKGVSGYYYRGIFEKYHISPGRYDQNLTFYRQNPEAYAKMYEKVIVALENRQKHFTGAK